MLRRFRPLVIVLGGLLVIGSLLGARLFSHGAGGDSGPKTTAQPADGKAGSGPVVIAFVDSDPPPVSLGLPPVLQSGEVAKVFVKQGDEVQVREINFFGKKIHRGDPLYRFNAAILEHELTNAERNVDLARAKLAEARGAVRAHATQVALALQAVDVAEFKVKKNQEAVQVAEYNLREQLRLGGTTDPKRVEEVVRNDIKIFELSNAHGQAQKERDLKKAELEGLKATKADKLDPLVEQAEAAIRQAEAMVDKARAAVDLCTVRARVSGTVERVSISPGDVMGIGTRTPAVVLVPAGPRVVRAEVEADFAHRVGPDRIGKTVTIYDHTNGKLTYKGVVRQIGTTFLQKRSTEGGFVPNDTRVLEVVVDVPDPSPPGQPPLRVGQKVRVDFGQ